MNTAKVLSATTFLIILLFQSSVGFSQDIIFFKDGTKDSVKVIEIGTELISYTKFKKQSRPIYKVQKSKVILIEFEDGTIEVIEAPKKALKENTLSPSLAKRNILTLNPFGLVVTNIHIGYENISLNGSFGLKLNLSASPFGSFDETLAVIGPDFNFYPFGQKKVSYFLGPSFRVGILEEEPIAAAVFNTGLAYNAKSGFYLSGQFGLGPGFFDYELIPYGFLMLNIGTRF